jgi:two-component system response regulator DesR
VGKIRVLHADDYVAFSDKLRKILEPEMEWIGAVYDGDAVIAKANELEPDVILLDVSMPGRNGFELARELLESAPDVRIIMVTVHGEPAYVQAAFDAGALGYVLKAAVASEIATAVREVFAGRTFVSAALRRNPRDFSQPN